MSGGTERRHPTCHGMHSHATEVLGLEVLLMVDSTVLLSETLPSVPRIDAGRFTSTTATSELPAMLFPRDAEIFTIYIDKNGGHFARARDSGFYVLKEHWRTLAHTLPPDSTCSALVYRERSGRLVMGVFDLTRLAGADKTAETVFARQEALYGLWRAAAVTTVHIVPHWVGMEGSLVKHMKDEAFLESLPFDVDNMLRMAASSDSEAMFQLVLRPLRL